MEKNSFRQKVWQLDSVHHRKNQFLADQLKRPSWQIELLNQRQFTTVEQVNNFIYPTLSSLPSSFLFKGMEKAVKIIEDVIKSRLSLVIVGDYDVDGVTGTALLARFFNTLGLEIICLHPDRFLNGYGLDAGLVMQATRNVGLVITVDCGISDAEQVKILKDAGWQIIITDHHKPPTNLPLADVILNPWVKGSGFPFKDLAGVGVAFYLAMGIRNYLVKKQFWPQGEAPNLKQMLDLVAVGTISDMVQLHGVNRILVKAGLQVIQEQTNEGLRQLIALSGSGSQTNSTDIAFQIAPRLNAAGRMGDARRASELLETQDRAGAVRLALNLDRENKRRKEITERLANEAMSMAQVRIDKGHCLILHGADWHEGVIGIVASKLVNHFHRPTIILTGKEVLKGSARSIPGVNMHDLLRRCEDLLISYGGHSAAAGLSINRSMLDEFNQRVEMYLMEIWASIETAPVLAIDLSVGKDIKIDQLMQFNELLEPFGQGNPEPIYCTRDICRLRNIKLIGKERSHIRFNLLLDGIWLNVIGFGFGKDAFNLLSDRMDGCQIAFHLQYNSFRGQKRLQLQLIDFVI